MLETNAWKCHVYTTGLVWQAMGAGKYDSSKEVLFRINRKYKLKHSSVSVFVENENVELISFITVHNTPNKNPSNPTTEPSIELTNHENQALVVERKVNLSLKM